MRAPTLLLLLATPVPAQEVALLGDWKPLGGEVFEALVTGRTLTYAPEGGEIWGIERFHLGRRVTWSRVGGECLEGVWYPAGPKEAPQVCFAYEDGGGPHCFRFYRDGEAILSTDLDGSGPELSRDAPLDVAHFGCEYLGF